VYYFIDEKTKELAIAIVYINDVCFMGSKDSPLLLKLKQKFIIKQKCYDLVKTKELNKVLA